MKRCLHDERTTRGGDYIERELHDERSIYLHDEGTIRGGKLNYEGTKIYGEGTT